ncbi:hypothetical protein EV363DRAFT_315309 [Boletus edulis]|nr:hypothetical protein EV363DRAFT_315309 [Boletus edulis]
MGVVGAWAGAHRERGRSPSIYNGNTDLHSESACLSGDPAGPFWLWKVPDDHPTSVRALIPIT